MSARIDFYSVPILKLPTTVGTSVEGLEDQMVLRGDYLRLFMIAFWPEYFVVEIFCFTHRTVFRYPRFRYAQES